MAYRCLVFIYSILFGITADWQDRNWRCMEYLFLSFVYCNLFWTCRFLLKMGIDLQIVTRFSNPTKYNKLLLQISLFLGIAHYLINMYLCSHILRVIFYINYKHLKEYLKSATNRTWRVFCLQSEKQSFCRTCSCATETSQAQKPLTPQSDLR